jgi:hypothetical protein
MKALPELTGRRRPVPQSDDTGSRFVPGPEPALYNAPKATIDPDRSKTWLRRALPILRSHQKIFIISLVLSFVGLVLQVLVPNLLKDAIDNSIAPALAHRSGYISRLYLFQTAYNGSSSTCATSSTST